MGYQITCPDCDYSEYVFGKDVAQGRTWYHNRTNGHDADFEYDEPERDHELAQLRDSWTDVIERERDDG